MDRIPEISDTLRKKSGDEMTWKSMVKRWLLLNANRALITGILIGIMFLSTVLVGAFGPVSVHEFIVNGISPATTLTELLKAIITVVTIVLSINQLALSPQLGSVDSQRERLEDEMDLREDIEELLDIDVSPSSPSRFLFVLTMATRKQAETLDGTVREDISFRPEIDEYIETLTADANQVTDELADAHFGRFEALPIVMGLNTSGKIRRARLIRKRHREELTDAEREALDDSIDTLELFAVARGYLKTVYIQSEFINFSRALLYVGVPSLLLTFWASQIYNANVFPGTTFGIRNLLWFVSASVTVALAPFAVLISYASRLATLSQSTLFIAPFVAGSTDED